MTLRAIRSFVRREGRMTPAQAAAVREHWPVYGLPEGDAPLDLDAVFGRQAPRVLEIGFGNGDALLELAQRQPDNDFIGIEVHRPGVGSLLRRAAAAGVVNLRVSTDDAVEVLRDLIPPASLAAVHLFFPDPWPKKRHHKRRIVQAEFVALVADRLIDGGRFHLATDWEPYAEWMREVLTACPALTNTARDGAFTPRPDTRPETRFERRGLRAGFSVKDLIFQRDSRR